MYNTESNKKRLTKIKNNPNQKLKKQQNKLKMLKTEKKNIGFFKKKQGKVVVQILVMMILIVLTSAIILALLKFDVINIGSASEDVSVLNSEFVPVGRGGSLAIRDFQFCAYIDDNYNCVSEGNSFFLGDEVHFQFIVESTTYNGEVLLIENYRVKGPAGEILLEVDDKSNFHFEIKSEEKKESITFKDYFTVGNELPVGEYTVELLLENTLLDKKVTLVKKFTMDEFYEGDY